ncbi:hypothetical protein GW17_00049215, partial [Ensete ventricosum]
EDYARFSPDTPIVIDNGGSSFRIGWAGESDPRVTFRNVVQRPRHKATALRRLAGERRRERTRRRLVLPRFSHWETRRRLVPTWGEEALPHPMSPRPARGRWRRLNPRGEGGGASSHTRRRGVASSRTGRRGVDSSLRGETLVLMVPLSSGWSAYRYPVEPFEAPVVAALVRIFLRHRCFRVQLTSPSRDRIVASFATDGTSEASSALDAVVRSFVRCRYCCLMVPPSSRLLSSEGSFVAVPLSFPTFHHQ